MIVTALVVVVLIAMVTIDPLTITPLVLLSTYSRKPFRTAFTFAAGSMVALIPIIVSNDASGGIHLVLDFASLPAVGIVILGEKKSGLMEKFE